jgi:hypothetical protein
MCKILVAVVKSNLNVLILCRDLLQPKYQSERNYSGPMLQRQKRDTNNLSSGMSIHSWIFFLFTHIGLAFIIYLRILLEMILLVYSAWIYFSYWFVQWRILQKEQLSNARDDLRSLQLISALRYIWLLCYDHWLT